MGAAGVKRLARLGMIDKTPGMAALDMNAAEDAVVDKTREVVPGMVVCGMEVAELDGAPRMGPTFGAPPQPPCHALLRLPRCRMPQAAACRPHSPPTLAHPSPAGAMFISGQKAAHVALASLRRQAEEEAAGGTAQAEKEAVAA